VIVPKKVEGNTPIIVIVLVDEEKLQLLVNNWDVVTEHWTELPSEGRVTWIGHVITIEPELLIGLVVWKVIVYTAGIPWSSLLYVNPYFKILAGRVVWI